MTSAPHTGGTPVGSCYYYYRIVASSIQITFFLSHFEESCQPSPQNLVQLALHAFNQPCIKNIWKKCYVVADVYHTVRLMVVASIANTCRHFLRILISYSTLQLFTYRYVASAVIRSLRCDLKSTGRCT